MRTFFVGGNWKCNGTVASVTELVNGLNQGELPKDVDVVVAPTYLHLSQVKASLRKEIQISAQNCLKQKGGAFTGEISVDQIKDVLGEGSWVILGHSERRHVFGETDQLISEKGAHALANGLKVIFCVGETLDQREKGETEKVVFKQMEEFIALNKDLSNVVVAYEPVWAIGTGKVATAAEAQDMHKKLREYLGKNVENGENVRIIYGGNGNKQTKKKKIKIFFFYREC